MTTTTDDIAVLAGLASVDPAVAPLIRLQAIALQAANEPTWAEGIPDLSSGTATADGAPLLDGLTLTVDEERQRALLGDLAGALAAHGSADAEALRSLFASPQLDPLVLLTASVAQQVAPLEELVAEVGIDPAVLTVVGQVAALPLLMACGQRAADPSRARSWSFGYCPVCGAWPTLAEVRGLARACLLRCGRCGSAWRHEGGACAFCGRPAPRDWRYLAAEHERESRRAITCGECRGYLKTVATLAGAGPSDLLLLDLQTVELDLAALANGYARPEAPAWTLSVRIEPALRSARRWRWIRWR